MKRNLRQRLEKLREKRQKIISGSAGPVTPSMHEKLHHVNREIQRINKILKEKKGKST